MASDLTLSPLTWDCDPAGTLGLAISGGELRGRPDVVEVILVEVACFACGVKEHSAQVILTTSSELTELAVSELYLGILQSEVARSDTESIKQRPWLVACTS